MKFSFSVPGKPIPKGRPRFTRVGQHVRTYTPAKTVAYEDLVALRARAAAKARRIQLPIDVPLRCEVWMYFKTPQRPRAHPHMDRRPDGENILKAVWDGLERGGIITDDARFVEFTGKKCYADRPRIEVRISEVS